jgi:basic membrane protein A
VRLRARRQVRQPQGARSGQHDRHHPSAWNDPARGGELAKAQFAKGVDVVFAAAGGTGVGVYQAAKDAGKLAIGVDSNQNHLQPGTMLTSMVKRVDVAVYNAFKGVTPGVTSWA